MTPEAPSVFDSHICVRATLISETEVCVQIITTDTFTEFLNITIAREVVEESIRKGRLQAEMLSVFVNANPANEVVRRLLPLLPKLISLDPDTGTKLDEFKTDVRELVGKNYVLP